MTCNWYGFLRAIVAAAICLPLAIPILLIKVSLVKSPIIIMFTNFIIPGFIGSYFIAGGPYDYLIVKLNTYLEST